MIDYASDDHIRRLISQTVHQTRHSFDPVHINSLADALPQQDGAEWRGAALAAVELTGREFDLPAGTAPADTLDPVSRDIGALDLRERLMDGWLQAGAAGVQRQLSQAGTVAAEGVTLVLIMGLVNLGVRMDSPLPQQWNAYIIDRIQLNERLVGHAEARAARRPGGCAAAAVILLTTTLGGLRRRETGKIR